MVGSYFQIAESNKPDLAHKSSLTHSTSLLPGFSSRDHNCPQCSVARWRQGLPHTHRALPILAPDEMKLFGGLHRWVLTLSAVVPVYLKRESHRAFSIFMFGECPINMYNDGCLQAKQALIPTTCV